MVAIQSLGALEGAAFTQQAHAAPDVHQAHGRDAPGIPALNKFLGANQNVDGRILLVDSLEQGAAELFLFDGDLGGLFLGQPEEIGVGADVDQPKETVGSNTGAQSNLALSGLRLTRCRPADAVAWKICRSMSA